MKIQPSKIIRAVAATAATVAFTMSTQVWVGMSTPWLRVNGRFFQDSNNRNVFLRGYMQAGASWFKQASFHEQRCGNEPPRCRAV